VRRAGQRRQAGRLKAKIVGSNKNIESGSQ
jgi:hypothetical protein